MYPQYKIK